MCKRITCIILLLLCLSYHKAHSQYAWFVDLEGSGYTGAESIVTDPDDNVLVIGNFENGISILGTTYTGSGSFLLKLTKNGTAQWHKVVRYTGTPIIGHLSSVGTDMQGNVYIAGSFPQTFNVAGTTISGISSYSSLVAKFDASGNLKWTKAIENVQEIFDMKVNAGGDILLYAHHYGTVVIDQVTLQVGSNSFGLLLSSNGILKWAKTIGNPLQYTTWPKACALSNAGDAYFHGIYAGTISLDGKQVTSAGGNYDFFFTQINASGVCQWITSAERKAPSNYETSTPPSGLIIERGALETDHQGNVYAGGTFWQGMKVGNFTLQDDRAFLLKLNANGIPQWIQTPSGVNSNGTVEDIVIRNQYVYFSGIRLSQFYFSVFTTAGVAVNETQSIPLNGDIASGLTVDSRDSVYMSGRFYDVQNLQGFVFKYKYNAAPRPLAAGSINEPNSFCIYTSEVVIKTTSIQGAQTYEWEIDHNNQRNVLQSQLPELQLSPQDYGIQGQFSVRVRGVNSAGAGLYSQVHVVKAIQALPEVPVLTATCAALHVDKGDATLQWYKNDLLMPSAGNANRISPQEQGEYHVTLSNACGSALSNKELFSPLTLDEIFMPNVITPNNDGKNEFFIVDAKLELAKLQVFNRWGNTVYAAREYKNEWSGKNLAAGVYYYQIKTECLPNPVTGHITIMR